MTLTFSRFVGLLKQPPFEPCRSEFDYYTPAEYDDSFTKAVQLHYRPVIRIIARITRDSDNAPDLAQEVFINVYRARSSFEKAYIYRAAKNEAYSALRRAGRRLRLYPPWVRAGRPGKPKQSDLPDTRPLPDAELMERIREEALMRAVERLPEHFRVPLLMRADGDSYRRIMDATGVNLGTVKSRICRGKSLLRQRLRGYLKAN